jgi:hypothetical protein
MLIVTDKIRQEMQELLLSIDLNHHHPMISFKKEHQIYFFIIIIKSSHLYILVFLVSKSSYYLALLLIKITSPIIESVWFEIDGRKGNEKEHF